MKVANLVNTKIFLTGTTGQVGGDLKPLLSRIGTVWAPTRNELDLANPIALKRALTGFRPNWIVNPAAYTAVDKAESEPSVAYALNRDAVAVMAETARKLNAGIIHFSTDYVYPGDGERPWSEDDKPAPLGVYGASKLAGDEILATSGSAYLIFRTSWVYGATGKNFLRTILNLAQKRTDLNIVADQHGSPTWSKDLARLAFHAICRAEQKSPDDPVQGLAGFEGVYNACNSGFTTWFGFAEEFIRLALEQSPKTSLARLHAIRTENYPTPARRPSNSRLNCSKLSNRLGFSMPTWQESIATVMQNITLTEQSS